VSFKRIVTHIIGLRTCAKHNCVMTESPNGDFCGLCAREDYDQLTNRLICDLDNYHARELETQSINDYLQQSLKQALVETMVQSGWPRGTATEHIDREFSFNKAKTLLQDSNALKEPHR